MSKIISFLSQKGGIGKSLSTVMAANILSQVPFDHSVFVCDCDKQRSIVTQRTEDLKSFDDATPYPVQQMTVKDFLSEKSGVYKLDKDYDFVFVDVAGKLDDNLKTDQQEIVKYLQLIDYLFIPFVSGLFQMSATLDFIKVAMKVQHKRKSNERPLKIFGYVNMAEERTIDNKIMLEEIEELKAMINIQFLNTSLKRYALFRGSNTLASFYETNPKGKAEQNLKAWFDEFYSIIK